MKNKELERLENAMQKLRESRLCYVEQTLAERQTENDKIAQVAGTKPTTPQLTIADYQIIEERYNRPLADLKERHRLAEAANAAASLDEIEDDIDKVQSAADEAQRVLEERLAAVNTAQGRLKIAQGIITRSKDRDRRIVFKSLVPDLMSDRIAAPRKKEIGQRILNY